MQGSQVKIPEDAQQHLAECLGRLGQTGTAFRRNGPGEAAGTAGVVMRWVACRCLPVELCKPQTAYVGLVWK